MSASINIPYPNYPGDENHYDKEASKFNTNAKLVINNQRFQLDVKALRKRFNIRTSYTIDEDFSPRPYTDNGMITTKTDSHTTLGNPDFELAVKDIVGRIHLDGNMVVFVRDYVLKNSSLQIQLSHLRTSIVATSETATDGSKYVNLRLNGPVTLKDIETNWSSISEKIAEQHPYARDKPKVHYKNQEVTWLMFGLKQKGLNDSNIAKWLNRNGIGNEGRVFTENAVGKKLDRLEEQIAECYR